MAGSFDPARRGRAPRARPLVSLVAFAHERSLALSFLTRAVVAGFSCLSGLARPPAGGLALLT